MPNNGFIIFCSQVLEYLADPDMALHSLNKYINIKKLFFKYNTALPSSAPVERLFSFASITDVPKSNRLSDEMFEKRVVLKSKLNLM